MARLNDLLTRAAIIWSTSITAINSIELYNLPVVIGGGGLRRNFETIGCLPPGPFSFTLRHSLSFRHPSLRLYPVRRPGLGEVISRIRRDDELSRSVLPLFRLKRAERFSEQPIVLGSSKEGIIRKSIALNSIHALLQKGAVQNSSRSSRKVTIKDNMGSVSPLYVSHRISARIATEF